MTPEERKEVEAAWAKCPECRPRLEVHGRTLLLGSYHDDGDWDWIEQGEHGTYYPVPHGGDGMIHAALHAEILRRGWYDVSHADRLMDSGPTPISAMARAIAQEAP